MKKIYTLEEIENIINKECSYEPEEFDNQSDNKKNDEDYQNNDENNNENIIDEVIEVLKEYIKKDNALKMYEKILERDADNDEAKEKIRSIKLEQ